MLLAGIETITVAPGTSGGYGSAIIHADYTHALLGTIVLAVLFGLAAGWRWGRRTGIVLALVVFSHWALDLIAHRPDLPLLPRNAGHFSRLGFGLWRHPLAAMAVELAIVAAGAFLYWRAAWETAAASGASLRRRAHLAGWLVLVCGLAVLAMDFTAIFG